MLIQEDEELRKLDLSTPRSSPRQHEQSNGDSGGALHNTTILASEKGSEVVLRKMLIDMFIEQAQLCKATNTLTCNAVKSKHERAR